MSMANKRLRVALAVFFTAAASPFTAVAQSVPRFGGTTVTESDDSLSAGLLTVGRCDGDCDGSGDVTVNELITMVNIALGNAQPSACSSGIPSGVEVDIALIIQAVNAALNGCSAATGASVTGFWSGTLTQPGGDIGRWSEQFNLAQDSRGAVSGTRTVVATNQVETYVIWSVSGHFSGGLLILNDVYIIASGDPAETWCVDTANLTLSFDGTTLSGTWGASTQNCNGGAVALTYQGPRPPASVTGFWAGTLIQPGGTTNWNTELNLFQDSTNSVSGTRTVAASNYVRENVTWSVTGHFLNGLLTLNDAYILATGDPTQTWCTDTTNLIISPNGMTLSGSWEAPQCSGGTESLTYQGAPR
jgi:hypothetical protein